MEKLYIATKEEFQALIDERLDHAFSRLSQPKQVVNRGVSGTRQEVCKELQISLSKLDTMTKTGELKSFKLGRQVRYKWSDIEEYLQKK